MPFEKGPPMLADKIDDQPPSPAILRHYKQAAHEIGDLFCWCVEHLENFPPREGEWIDEVKLRLQAAALVRAERGIKALEWSESVRINHRTNPKSDDVMCQASGGHFEFGITRVKGQWSWWSTCAAEEWPHTNIAADSLEAAKDACWQDYLARLAPIFETPPALAKAKEPA